MIELRAGDQTIRFDPRATAEAYASLPGGWSDACGCLTCRNFAAQRATGYPVSFLTLLEQLGIDASKEAEAVAGGPPPGGLYHYGGWFSLVGELIEAGSSIVEVSDSPYFAYFFNRGLPCPEPFRSMPHIVVEFIGHFPWVLPEPGDAEDPIAGRGSIQPR